jgi:hypothetical protein
MLGKSINTVKKKTEALLEANREVCLGVNTEKMKCLIMSHRQNV